MNTELSYIQRVRIVFISLLFLGTPRKPDFKCWQFVHHVYRTARIPRCDAFKNIPAEQKNRPPFGEAIFLLEKGVHRKRWSHVVIALPRGYVIHMSYYWGEKVTISKLELIWKHYDLAV